MTYQTIDVKSHSFSYPIYVGEELLSRRECLIPFITGQQVLIVTQEKIAQHYLSVIKQMLQDYQCAEVILADGEQVKNLHEWQKILEMLMHLGYERSCTVIALGGGVVGDIAGFVAACYQRGVNFIQIPTTLMSQVDSSIGGKTAVNHSHGKNMIGAFYQPRCVIADVAMLKTLSQQELISGFAEVIKYGLIADAHFFIWLEKNFQSVLDRDATALLYVISRSAAIKAEIVSQDEKESSMRSLLNFGHTFGHALEAAYEYQDIRHGEAVALGMAIASQLSVMLGAITSTEFDRMMCLLRACGLLEKREKLPSYSKLMTLMLRDKKVQDGKLNLIVLKKIGQAEKKSDIKPEMIELAINKVLDQLK
jgi:3-dehydroquinate synthase